MTSNYTALGCLVSLVRWNRSDGVPAEHNSSPLMVRDGDRCTLVPTLHYNLNGTHVESHGYQSKATPPSLGGPGSVRLT